VKKAKIFWGVLALAAAASAEPMRFTQAGTYIVAQGDITSETPAEFGRLSATPGMDLYFDSPGGNLIAGLELGRLIRRAGLNTRVAPSGAGCYSACVYAFAGGVVRTYDGHGELGVHQFHGGLSERSVQTTLALLSGYLDEMGVDHRLLEVASLVPPEEVQAIPVKAAQEWGLANSQAVLSTQGPLRSECSAQEEQIKQEQEDQLRQVVHKTRPFFVNAASRYDTKIGRCYVRIDMSVPQDGVRLEFIADGATRKILAGANQYGDPQSTEAGFITGIMQSGNASADINERLINGHAAYTRARAFIEARMKEGL
jgi:hypothetical protein